MKAPTDGRPGLRRTSSGEQNRTFTHETQYFSTNTTLNLSQTLLTPLNIVGNPGWNYENVLKYFIKSEDNRNPYLAKTPYHGTGGLLTVQESPWRTPLVVAFVQAGTEMGYQNRDINGAEQAGKFEVQFISFLLFKPIIFQVL